MDNTGMLGAYLPVLRTPNAVALMLWAVVARMHSGGLPIAVTFLVAGWTGSYALAGLVVGGLTLGTAIAGPVRGRMVDTGRADRALVVSGVGFAIGLGTIALLPESLWWLSLPLALGTGLFTPPASQVVRSAWPRLLDAKRRQTMYAVEGSMQELIFVAGPLLSAAAVALAGGRAATGALAVVVLLGSFGLAWQVRRAGIAEGASSSTTRAAADGAGKAGATKPGGATPLRHRPVLVLTGFTLALVAGIGAVDLTIVAFARELSSPGLGGTLAAIWAVGSLVGGLVAGLFTGPPRLTRRSAGTTLGLVAPVVLVPPILDLPTPWLLAPALFLAGTVIAPTLAAAMSRLGELAPADRRAESFGWLNTAASTGIALAAPIAGALIDLGGVAAGFAAGAVLGLVATALSLAVPGGRQSPGGG
jgi:MFS family permease